MIHCTVLETEAKAVCSTEVSEYLLKILTYWTKLQVLNCAFQTYLDQTHPLSHLICHQAPPPILVPGM